jgi:hypothetical protein
MTPLLDMEQPLVDLKCAAGILAHMATSERAVTGDELGYVRRVLDVVHETMHELWAEALEEARAREATSKAGHSITT